MTSHDREHFGVLLRRAREAKGLALADVAAVTRVPRATLGALEAGALDELPAEIFVRGFVRSFARAVGAPADEVLAHYDRDLAARTAKATVTPPPVSSLFLTDEEPAPRRGVGLAVFVLLLILLATITLSLLLRRPPPSGEGLSLAPAARTAPRLFAACAPVAPPLALGRVPSRRSA